MHYEPRTPNYETRVRDSFAKQNAMKTIGATIESIEPGHVILAMPFNPQFTQQHGFLHAGIITTMLDSAAGYAAFSLMPEEAAVLTVELKTSLLAPARGQRFCFVGQVTKPGRTITFTTAEAIGIDEDGKETKIAMLSATMMAITGRQSVRE